MSSFGPSVTLPSANLDLSTGAQSTILIAMTIVGVVASVEAVNTSANPPKGAKLAPLPSTIAHIVIGCFIATLLLMVLSYVLPDFAKGLAIIAVVTTLLSKGQPFWNVIIEVTGGTPTTQKGQ